MNILRGTIASLFVQIFLLTSVAAAIGLGVDLTLKRQNAVLLVDQAKAGERLVAVLPDFVAENFVLPGNIKLKTEDIKLFVSETFPLDEVNLALRGFFGDTASYILGESDQVSKIDLVSTETRAEAVAKKTFPGFAGRQLAVIIRTQFEEAGLDKGLEIPREKLNAARKVYAQFHLGVYAALVLSILSLLVVFAVAPDGWRGRLKRCGVALVVSGLLSALSAVGILALPGLAFGLSAGGNIPPSVQSFIKDVIAAFGGWSMPKMLAVAAIYEACGIALLISNKFLRKQVPPAAPVSDPAPKKRIFIN